MTGGCGMSEKLCYFCREPKMRPLPAGKRGEKRKKAIQRAFRWLAVTWELRLGNPPNDAPPYVSGGVARWLQTLTQSTWLRWSVSPESWKSALALSLLFINIFHQVGRRHGENGGVTKGEKRKGGEVAGGTTCWKLASLPFSRHVQQQEGSFPVHVTKQGSLCPPVTSPHRSFGAVWGRGPGKSGRAKDLWHPDLPIKCTRFITTPSSCSWHKYEVFVARFCMQQCKECCGHFCSTIRKDK